MPSRKDQLHSYQFMMHRVVSSVMVHETDPEQAPLRRGVGAVFGGVMLAAIVAAVFGIVGVLTNAGGTGWRADGSIIIERETGALYVYQDNAVRPTPNFASARLLSGDGTAEPSRVSTADLEDVPRKSFVGIPGAPESLPGALADGVWTLCSELAEDESGTLGTSTALLVGQDPIAGTDLGDRGLLVRDDVDGSYHLIWGSHRYPLLGPDPEALVRSLYGVQRDVVDVGRAWLNGLPAGRDIAPIEVADRGAPSAALPQYRVGDIVAHPVRDRQQHYLVRADALSPLTEFQVGILRGQFPVEPAQISAQVANGAAIGEPVLPYSRSAEWPGSVPELAPLASAPGATVCAATTNASSSPRVLVGDETLSPDRGMPTVRRSDTGVALADRILVPPGRVAVVRAMPSGTAPTGALSVVTDLGIRFPVPTPEELAALGYDVADAAAIPAGLVQRIPEGPTLSQVDARGPVSATGARG